jgi:hypothetical protein
MRSFEVGLALTLVIASLSGCSSSSSSGSGESAPSGLTCSATSSGGADADSLTAALASAAAGSCVLVAGATYSGTFTIPAGVTLAGANGAQVRLTGGTSTEPVVSIAGGTGSGLWNIGVTNAAGVGVAVRNGGASLSNVNVSGAQSSAFAALCQGSSCLDSASAVVMDNVTLTTSSLGAWVSGALVQMSDSNVTNETSTSLTGGIGIVVLGGGRLELTDVQVTGNDGVGVLVDGSGGTTALIQGGSVSNNTDRGIWAQNLSGTMASPALSIQASAMGPTVVQNNQVVGVGAVNSHGIIFVGGSVLGTRLAPVVTSLGTTDQVGDGVGFFGGSSEVQLDALTISQNGRAGAIVDDNIGAIIFVGGSVLPGSSGLLVVVQDTQDETDVTVPHADLSTTKAPLAVSAPTIPAGAVLQ